MGSTIFGDIVRCNRKKLADILGHDVKTVDKMVSEGMPYVSRPGDGGRSWVFDTGAIMRWLMRDQIAEQAKKHRSQLLEAKAGLKFLEYVERLGIVVRKREITDRIEAGDAIVVSRFKAMPQRLAHIVAEESNPEVIAQLIDKELDGVLEELDKPWNERGQIRAEAGRPSGRTSCVAIARSWPKSSVVTSRPSTRWSLKECPT